MSKYSHRQSSLVTCLPIVEKPVSICVMGKDTSQIDQGKSASSKYLQLFSNIPDADLCI